MFSEYRPVKGWQPMTTFPKVTDERPFQAMSSTWGECRVQWMPHHLVAKVMRPDGSEHFLHSAGNAQGYDTVQDAFVAWRLG
jgi:hypothetical protein